MKKVNDNEIYKTTENLIKENSKLKLEKLLKKYDNLCLLIGVFSSLAFNVIIYLATFMYPIFPFVFCLLVFIKSCI